MGKRDFYRSLGEVESLLQYVFLPPIVLEPVYPSQVSSIFGKVCSVVVPRDVRSHEKISPWLEEV